MDFDTYVSVTACARCGRDHGVLLAVAFRRPIVDEDGAWTHWATCPVTGDPTMIQRRPSATNERVRQAMAQSGEKL